ncbi:GNAT family N-acetyltransferase [Pseudomonas sp. CGJS7]|uniref:GNAT family N-acetyltransferase n=1 Tax=Pseudomonas sp. CGJS7 TaxID=3109348 RepID=UPI00300A05C8
MHITEEQTAHRAQIHAITRAAFGGDGEADLVDRLREDGLVRLSLVAIEDAQVVGHVLFTALAVQVDGREVDALCLAPISVRPDYQGSGVGSMLIREALARLADDGYEAVVVLGHPEYYPRFGFSAALASKLAAPFSGEAFMALELVEGALRGEAGRVRYPDAFGIDAAE